MFANLSNFSQQYVRESATNSMNGIQINFSKLYMFFYLNKSFERRLLNIVIINHVIRLIKLWELKRQSQCWISKDFLSNNPKMDLEWREYLWQFLRRSDKCRTWWQCLSSKYVVSSTHPKYGKKHWKQDHSQLRHNSTYVKNRHEKKKVKIFMYSFESERNCCRTELRCQKGPILTHIDRV